MDKFLDSAGLEHLWSELKKKISTKADYSSAVSNVVYDTLGKKLVRAIGDSVDDIVTVERLKQDFALTKADVGLGNVDNTADENKNVASAVTAQALVSSITKPVTANEMHNNDHRVKAFLASSNMTTGKPPVDAHVLHFSWETGTAGTGTRDAQLALSSGGVTHGLYYRTQTDGIWSDWNQVYSDENAPSYTAVGLEKVKNLHQKALEGENALVRRANLNSVTTIGNYYALTDVIANSLTNSPTNKAFHMFVGLSNGQTEGYEYQEIIEAETGIRYYRRRQGNDENGWTDWTTFMEYAAGDGIGIEGNSIYTKVSAASVDSTRRITDLGKNKYVIEDFSLDADDLPSQHSYIILTATGSNVRYGTQIAMSKNVDKVYFRRYYNSIYGDWFPMVYTAGGGLSLDDGKFTNIGVYSVTTGAENGTIKVNTNGTVENVAVRGLGSRAFDNTEYLPIAGGTLTGSVTASRSGAVGLSVETTNENNRHKGTLYVTSGGTLGVYDDTFDKWIVSSDKNGKVLLNGNAETATQFAADQTVQLSGDVNGSTSSKAGWLITTTLANTNVTSGNYGPTADATLSYGGTFKVPYFTVDSKGRLTGAADRTFTLPSMAETGVTAGNYGPSSSKTLKFSDEFTVPYYTVDAYGRITNSINRTLTLPSFDDTGVTNGSYGQSANSSPSHGGTFKVPYFTVNKKGQITAASTITITLPEDKNTTYTAGDGISISSGEIRNTGIRSLDISTGTRNGTISVSKNGGTASNVSVYGLGSAAYKESSDFATSGHTHYYAGSSSVGGAADSVANSLVIKVDSGTSEGTGKYTFNGSASKTIDIKAGTNVSITRSSGSFSISATDTTYSAGTGLSLSSSNVFSLATSGVSAGSAGPTADVTGTEGATFKVPRLTVDTYGRVTALSSYTITAKDTHYLSYIRAGGSSDTSNAETSNGYTYLNLVENGTRRSGVLLSGNTDMNVYSNSSGTVYIKSAAVRSSSVTYVYSSSWSTFSDSYISSTYPYRAFVSVSGVTASQYPDITFRPSDVEAWELASICQSAAGGVYIYSKKKPTSTIYILGMRFF